MIKTAQLHETITKLKTKLQAKESEVKNLKKMMRKMFVDNEEKIVDQSYYKEPEIDNILRQSGDKFATARSSMLSPKQEVEEKTSRMDIPEDSKMNSGIEIDSVLRGSTVKQTRNSVFSKTAVE